MNTKEYKQHKSLKKENLRDNMTNLELVLQGTSKNPNSVAMLRCSKNFNAYISNICGALKFFSRLA